MLPSDCKPLPRARAGTYKHAVNIIKYAQSHLKMGTASRRATKSVPVVRNAGLASADTDEAAAIDHPLRKVVSVLLIVEDNKTDGIEKVSLFLMLLDTEKVKQPKKYVKLTREEKQMTINLADAMGDRESLNKKVEFIKSIHPRFCNVSKQSLHRYREELADSTKHTKPPAKPVGRPKVVSDEFRAGIGVEVCRVRPDRCQLRR